MSLNSFGAQPSISTQSIDLNETDIILGENEQEILLNINSVLSENIPESSVYDKPSKKQKISEVLFFDIHEILNDHPLGPSVLSYYKAFSELENRIQGRLCEIVSLFYIRRYGMTLTNEDLEKIARDIVSKFNNECLESYYVAPIKRKDFQTTKYIGAKGKLVNAYKYNCTIIREGQHWKSLCEVPSDSKPKDSQLDHIEKTEPEKSKTWLINNRDIEDVLKHWDISYALRENEIESNQFQTVTDIYNDWPILKDSIGYQLIERDFVKKFGDNNTFGDNWQSLFDKTISLYRTKLRESETKNLELLERQPNLTENAKSLLQIKILSSVLCSKSKTVSIKSTANKGKKKNVWKPDLEETRDGIFIHVPMPGAIETKVRAKNEKMLKMGLPVQPFMIIVGKDSMSIDACYVRVDNVQYEIKSILNCLNTLLKVFLTFKVSYPVESETFWYFIQWGVYNIHTSCDIKIPFICDLFNKLKRR
ncbi:uncharacterized protein LOC130672879 [Microplitis mediator]|uniref:uncharacterized protein LOC130672879 n=1 Tax=Microplitis mediator TaxID=375433 RepID=UPI002554E89F|nr:uncharacterized protein LOC130672879 [Microplitis mediator]